MRSGHLSVVFHPEDHRCRGVIDRYRTLLRSHATFSAFDLSQVISAWRPFAGEWLQTFADALPGARYKRPATQRNLVRASHWHSRRSGQSSFPAHG